MSNYKRISTILILIFIFSFKIINEDSILVNQEDKYLKGFKRMYGTDNIDIWGQGIISDIRGNKGEKINFPETSIQVYNLPNGKAIGQIIYKKGKTVDYDSLFLIISDKKEIFKITIKDLFEINFHGTCMKYYEMRNDYYKVLINLYDNGVWVDKRELKNYGFVPIDWKTFLIQANKCYHPISLKKLLITDSEGNIIDTLIRNKNVIRLTNETIDDYFKVEIYWEGVCGGCSKEKTGEGWLKIIDENGHPKIYYYTRGC